MIQFILYGFIHKDKTATISHLNFFNNLKIIDKDIEIIIIGEPHDFLLESWYKTLNCPISFSDQPIQSFFLNTNIKAIFLCNYYTYFFPYPFLFSPNKINLFSNNNLTIHSSYPIYIPQKCFSKLSFLFFLYLNDKIIYDVRILLLKKKDFIIHNSSSVF